jgi:RNA polymerase sigma-70 factor (ECF subfamily)
MSPTRYSSMPTRDLLRACAEAGDETAWIEFVARFRRPISLSVLRIAAQRGKNPSQLIDDLVQETYVKLCADRCRRLSEFAEKSPEAVQAYICTIAINVARDHFKALQSQKRGDGETDQLPEEGEPRAEVGNLAGPNATERGVLLQEINKCLEATVGGPDRARDCLIFRLYYHQGFSAKAISSLPTIGLTAKGVETVILRLTKSVRERLVGLKSQAEAGNQPEQKGLRQAKSY